MTLVVIAANKEQVIVPAGRLLTGPTSDPDATKFVLVTCRDGTAVITFTGTNRKTDGFVRDRLSKKVRRVTVAAGGGQARGKSDDVAISGDGRYAAFESLARNLVPKDTNKKKDVFRRSRLY